MEEKKATLLALKEELRQRFSPGCHDVDIYSLCQQLGESCTDYFSRCQQAMMGRNCPPDIQVMTVMRGLLPALQPHVLLKAPQTMEAVREAMLLAEMASSRLTAT